MAAEQEQCQMAPETPVYFFLRHICQSHLKIQIVAGCTLIPGDPAIVDTLNKAPPGHIHIINSFKKS